MAKRRKQELDFIKSFVDGAYNRLGNVLYVDTDKEYSPEDPESELGYCFKHTDPVNHNVIYQIKCSRIGISNTDYRILMHEYGHIYLGHLDGIHEELDSQIVSVFRDQRGELINQINEACGIDFADKLIERVIDDPVLNHSLHNIAMDMEVNSKVLSDDDIDEMEMDITSILPKYQEKALEYLKDKAPDEETKKQIQDVLNKMQKEAKIKLILPQRYHMGKDKDGKDIPFPNELTYAEYLILIIEHLDQFVKMLVSINMGGNGDTSEITKEMVQQALQNYMNQQQQGKSDAYNQGYQDAMKDYYNGTPGQTQQQVNAQNNPNQQGQQQPQNGQANQQGPQGQPRNGQGQPNGGSQPGSQQGGQPQMGPNGQPMPGNGGQPGAGQPGGMSGQGGSGQGQPQQGGMPSQGNGGQSAQGQGQGQSGSPTQGNGGGMSQQDLQDYNQGYQDGMNQAANGGGQGSGMQSLSSLMGDCGMSADGASSGDGQGQGDGSGQGQGQQGQGQGQGSGAGGSGRYQGMRKDPTKDHRMDHRTDSRDEADRKRALGKITSAGGVGCGDSGGPDATREVDKNVDPVEMAMNEVMQNVKAKVVKQELRRDVMKLYNRGIIRSTIAPTVSKKVTVSVDPKIVYLIDISGSMDTRLIDRILKSIGKSMRKLNRGLKYDIITWSTCLGEHIKDIDPKKGVPRISMGGGTSMASGMQYFKDHYGPEAILIVISDFEDYLEEWHKVELTMPEYDLWGFNYGDDRWQDSKKIDWKNMKIRRFNNQ